MHISLFDQRTLRITNMGSHYDRLSALPASIRRRSRMISASSSGTRRKSWAICAFSERCSSVALSLTC